MARYAMAIDLDRCVGCGACVLACKGEWNVMDGGARDWVIPILPEGRFPDVASTFYTGLCNHCDEPSCVPACPTGATYQDESGRVRVDKDLCIGCGYCVAACPYGARYHDARVHKVDKCDLCAERLDPDPHREPACVQTCPASARIFGDLSDPSSRINALVYGSPARRLETAEVAIGPNVYYLGDAHHVDQILAHHPPDPHRTVPPLPGLVWSRFLRPAVLAGVAVAFAGQAAAFFYQLARGEKPFGE